jgi:hypothetical protein
MTWLDKLPVVRSRRALAEATRKLEATARQLEALREEAHKQERRLAKVKDKRRRLERRLRSFSGSQESRPLLVFDHIPKTAGTTFRRSYLIAALPSEERWILAGGSRNKEDRDRFLSFSPTDRRRIRIVAGHDAETLRPHLPDARFITIVRDPVTRTISSYLHARFHDDGEMWLDVREQNMSLSQFAARYTLPNSQSRTLLGDDFEQLDDAAIRQRVEARYALVGYTEAFDEFVFMLHVTEGMPLCLYGNRLVRAERDSYQPSDHDLECVRAANRVDARLHRVVRESFQARVEGLSDESKAEMRRFLDSLKAHRQ